MAERIGLIAGNGVFPQLFAEAARKQGLQVVAVAHHGEAEPSLADHVDELHWVRLGQVSAIVKRFKASGVSRAVMAGGIGRVKALTAARPDLGAVKIITSLRSFRDDALLRAVAAHFEREGITIVAPTDFVKELLAPEGHLGGPLLSEGQDKDIALGLEVASALGKVDVGQTVIVRQGHVLALEAVEGTDEAIRRGGKYGGRGAVVVKLSKPGQDTRFDLPAVGVQTLATMAEVGAVVLAVEARRTILLEPNRIVSEAEKRGITVVGVRRHPAS
jgi:hypothetical protein